MKAKKKLNENFFHTHRPQLKCDVKDFVIVYEKKTVLRIYKTFFMANKNTHKMMVYRKKKKKL